MEEPKPSPPREPEPQASEDDEPYPLKVYLIGIAAFILAALLLAWFAVEFAAWNKEQACATAGRRNCGGPPIRIDR